MVVRYALALVAFMFSTACMAPFHHCMQTRTSCSIVPYSLIEFVNRTDTNKITYAQRLWDGKPLGDPLTKVVPAHWTYTYQIPPGVYLFGTRTIDGTVHEWKTAESLTACETVTINMSVKPTPKKPQGIRPRRQAVKHHNWNGQ